MEHALAWLEPHRVAPVVEVTGDLPGAAGQGRVDPTGALPPRAAGTRYDGLVGRTPGAHLVAVDLLSGPDARAASLGPLVPRGAALARQAAVWVHTGRLCPAQVAVVVPSERRLHAAVTVHRQRLAPDDVVSLAGVPVTTLVRTAVDLLCFVPPEPAVAGVRALLAAGLAAQGVRDALGIAAGRPARRARALLSTATGTAP